MVYLPLWKTFISQMGVLFPKYGKIKMFQTTNQYLLDTFGVLCCVSPTRQHAESFNYVLFFLRCGVGVTGFQLRRVVPESSSKAIQKHPLLPASTPRLSGTPRQSTKKSEVKKHDIIWWTTAKKSCHLFTRHDFETTMAISFKITTRTFRPTPI